MTADAVSEVWTYATALMSALRPADSGVTFTLAVLGPSPSASQRACVEALSHVRVRMPAYRPFRLEWMPDCDCDVYIAGRWLQRLVQRSEPDLIHLNGYAHAALPFDRPVVTVAHGDMRSRWRALNGEPAPACWDTYARRVQAGLAGSSRIVASTQAMADALRGEYGCRAPIAVIANGLPRPPRPLQHASHAAKESYIFATGQLSDGVDNLAVLDDVAQGLPWPVVVADGVVAGGAGGGGAVADGAGGAGHSGEARAARAARAERAAREEPQARESARPRHLWHVGAIDHAELQQRCAHAAIYAHPARYEPVGLTVLEAAQAGCALLLGDIPSLREVWGDAALYVDPTDRVAVRAALLRLIGDRALRGHLAAAARARAGTFSHHLMGAWYLEIYRALMVERDAREALRCGESLRGAGGAGEVVSDVEGRRERLGRVARGVAACGS